MDFLNNSQPDNTQNSYLNSNNNPQGGYQPIPDLGYKFAITSLVFGGFACVSGIIIPIIAPCILGGLSIVFAILSKGYHNKSTMAAKGGIGLSIFAILLNFIVIFGFVYLYFNNPQIKTMYDSYIEDTTGMTMDELMEEYNDLYNLNLEEFQ